MSKKFEAEASMRENGELLLFSLRQGSSVTVELYLVKWANSAERAGIIALFSTYLYVS